MIWLIIAATFKFHNLGLHILVNILLNKHNNPFQTLKGTFKCHKYDQNQEGNAYDHLTINIKKVILLAKPYLIAMTLSITLPCLKQDGKPAFEMISIAHQCINSQRHLQQFIHLSFQQRISSFQCRQLL